MLHDITLVNTEEQPMAAIHLLAARHELEKLMDPAIQEVLQAIKEQGMQPAGPLVAYHHRRPTDTFEFEIGFPVTGAIRPTGRVKASLLPAARVMRAMHHGPYEQLAEAWQQLMEAVKEKGLVGTGRFWECYLNAPGPDVAPADLRTELNLVVG